MSAFAAVLKREILLAWRTGGAGLALAFFVLVIVLLPLAAGTDPLLLRRAGPGLVWIAAVLAVLLTLERLFQIDLEAAVLDLMAGAATPLEALALAKSLAHWLAVGLPVTLLGAVAALLLGLTPHAALILVLSLAIGTPGVSATGAIAAALTAGVRRGSLLITLLVMPLYAPFVIFGAGAATLAANPMAPLTPWPGLVLLAAASLISIVSALLFTASAVRSQLD